MDPSIVPEGKHLMNVFVQFAPYSLAEGKHWDDIKEDFADRCIQLLQGMRQMCQTEHRQVLSPLDLEREFGLTGGNIMQGAMSPNQLFFNRPVTGWADHERRLSVCRRSSKSSRWWCYGNVRRRGGGHSERSLGELRSSGLFSSSTG